MIVALGSSSVEPGSPLIDALAAELGEPVEARGVRGSRVSQWAAWCAESSHGTHDGGIIGAMVLVLLGGNDTAPSAADVQAIDATLRAQGAAVVVWIPPPPYLSASVAAGRDQRMRAALRAAGVAYVRREARLRASEYGHDLVHPTRAGYRRWSRTIAPEIAGFRSLARGEGYGPTIALAALSFLVARWAA